MQSPLTFFRDNIINKQEKTNIASGHFYPCKQEYFTLTRFSDHIKLSQYSATRIGDHSGLP